MSPCGERGFVRACGQRTGAPATGRARTTAPGPTKWTEARRRKALGSAAVARDPHFYMYGKYSIHINLSNIDSAILRDKCNKFALLRVAPREGGREACGSAGNLGEGRSRACQPSPWRSASPDETIGETAGPRLTIWRVGQIRNSRGGEELRW